MRIRKKGRKQEEVSADSELMMTVINKIVCPFHIMVVLKATTPIEPACQPGGHQKEMCSILAALRLSSYEEMTRRTRYGMAEHSMAWLEAVLSR